MESKRVYKKKSSYKKGTKGFQGVPAWAKKETGARLVNIEQNEIESPQHRNICSTNTVEPAVSGRKLADKEIDSIVDINNSARTSNITTKTKTNVNQNLNDHAIKGYKIIDANLLQELFNAYSKCKHCEKEKRLYLFQKNTSRGGMPENFYVKFVSCQNNLNHSIQVKQQMKILLISIYAQFMLLLLLVVD